MIFQYTYEAVLRGTKTQTRRVIKSGDQALYGDDGSIVAVLVNGREKWRVGKPYSVQPSRTKPQIARIRITAIRQEQVSQISDSDVVAEGYETRQAFLDTWVAINGIASLNAQVWVLEFELIN